MLVDEWGLALVKVVGPQKKPHLIEKWGSGTVKDDKSLAVRDSGASTAHACDYSEY